MVSFHISHSTIIHSGSQAMLKQLLKGSGSKSNSQYPEICRLHVCFNSILLSINCFDCAFEL